MKLAQQRKALGLSIAELARRTGLSRPTLAAIEAGTASRDSYLRLEEWFDTCDGDPDEGVEVEESSDSATDFEIEVTGPTTRFHFVVRGKAEHADVVREQTLELVRNLREADEGR